MAGLEYSRYSSLLGEHMNVNSMARVTLASFFLFGFVSFRVSLTLVQSAESEVRVSPVCFNKDRPSHLFHKASAQGHLA